MKLSLANFKSISRLNEFEIKPLTILSGTNSTGKSSLIQFLLLIKQTIQLESPNFQLALNGDFFEVKDFIDLLRGRTFDNKLEAGFVFDKAELSVFRSRLALFDSINYTCKIQFSYDGHNEQPFISDFSIQYFLEGDQKVEGQFVRFLTKLDPEASFDIQTNNELFVKGIWNAKPVISKIGYSGIYPTSYDLTEVYMGIGQRGERLEDERSVRYLSDIDSVKVAIDSFFTRMSYIGPLRQTPKDSYSIRGRHETVGAEGEYVAEVLESMKNRSFNAYIPGFNDEGIKFSLKETTLLAAVNFWICDIFKLAREIKSTKVEDTYSIKVKSNLGTESTIKHVGFGMSQVLPIIVEGLLLDVGATLVLEQPEIHLHPKLQSLLFDFLYSLTLKGVNVIVETHSDHFITRLRRRIAEDNSNLLQQKVNLTFIETVGDSILFRTIEVDGNGALQYFPTDFMEESGVETKAILKAQLKKRSQQFKK
jgi:predicted ATPase